MFSVPGSPSPFSISSTPAKTATSPSSVPPPSSSAPRSSASVAFGSTRVAPPMSCSDDSWFIWKNALLKVTLPAPASVRSPELENGLSTVSGAPPVQTISFWLKIKPVPVTVTACWPEFTQLLEPPINSSLSSVRVSELRFTPRSKPPLAKRLPLPVNANGWLTLKLFDAGCQVVSPFTVTSPAPPRLPSCRFRSPLMVAPVLLIRLLVEVLTKIFGETGVLESRVTVLSPIIRLPVPLKLLDAVKL